jgi:hypothetical protein
MVVPVRFERTGSRKNLTVCVTEEKATYSVFLFPAKWKHSAPHSKQAFLQGKHTRDPVKNTIAMETWGHLFWGHPDMGS